MLVFYLKKKQKYTTWNFVFSLNKTLAYELFKEKTKIHNMEF